MVDVTDEVKMSRRLRKKRLMTEGHVGRIMW